MTQKATLINGQLYLNALPLIPLIPQSETRFESTGAVEEFLLLGPDGQVTRLVLGQTEGDAIYDRKPEVLGN